MVDLYINNRFFGYKNSCNYYDIDVDNILLFKESNNEYIIRYNDLNKMTVGHFLCEIDTYTNNITLISIYSDDKELFRKWREICNKITELIGTNNVPDFVKNTIDDDADEFIMVDVHKNTGFVEGNYKEKLVIVLHSVFNNYLKTSLIQVKKHKFT